MLDAKRTTEYWNADSFERIGIGEFFLNTSSWTLILETSLYNRTDPNPKKSKSNNSKDAKAKSKSKSKPQSTSTPKSTSEPSSDSPPPRSPRPSASTSRRAEPKPSTSTSTLGKSTQTNKKDAHSSARKEGAVIAAFERRLDKENAKVVKLKRRVELSVTPLEAGQRIDLTAEGSD